MALGSYYYAVVASPQYEATAHFTIEKTGQASSSPLGFLTGIAGPTSSTRDALIIKHLCYATTISDFLLSVNQVVIISKQLKITHTPLK